MPMVKMPIKKENTAISIKGKGKQSIRKAKPLIKKSKAQKKTKSI